MYDYVLQFGFDNESQFKVQEIRNHIRQNGFVDRQRGWLPHITIDMYKCKNQNQFIEIVDEIVKGLKRFEIKMDRLDDFFNEYLHIKPEPIKTLAKIKQQFDKQLNDYMLASRRTKEYTPHISLSQNDELEKSQEVAMEKFVPWNATVCKIWVYNKNMQLVKEYKLK